VADESRELMTSVARMYYLDGRGQHEIADIVGASRSTVSRLLASARERGIVRISVDEYDPRDRELERQLAHRFDLRHSVVIKTMGRAAENVRRTIGYFAASSVSQLITSDVTVGVAGGRTLGELISFIAPVERVRNATVVQLMGNIGPNASGIDALELSRVLAQQFDGTFYTLNAPAFVQDRETRDLFLAHEHIQAIWRLFESLQLALVGIGSLDDSAFVERGVFDTGALTRLRGQGAVGEICGRFFDRAGRECRTEYRDRVISIDLDVLRRRPEVVGVTNGASRAEATSAAVRGKLVTSLVIDDIGAQALLALPEWKTA
jgi:deoxyribonucleoside regulator